MAVEIKSGNSTDLATVDPVSKAFRFTQYRSNGTEVVEHIPDSLVVGDVTVVDNDLIASFDASAYSYISFQLRGTWVGEVRFQESNDNGTFEDIMVQNAGGDIKPYVKSITVNSIIKIPILAKYLRVRVTAFTSGVIEGTSFAYREDIHTGQISSTGEVTIAAGQTVAEVTNISKLGGQSISMGSGAVDAGTQRVVLAPATDPLQTDFYVTGVGAVDVNSRMIRTGACELIAAIFTSYAATPRHIKLYDTATAPVAGVGTPVLVLTRAASGNNAYPLPAGGFPFVNGIGMTFVQGAANNNAIGTATVDGSLTSIFT